MPKPVFPVVRLPYDQPDRVARVLDAVRRELTASRRQTPTAVAVVTTDSAGNHQQYRHPQHRGRETGRAMTARLQNQIREPVPVESSTATGYDVDHQHHHLTVIDQVTVGVRDCTLTPKARPEIMVNAGAPAYPCSDKSKQQHSSPAAASAYLLVPPVNITAEISRPPLTRQYTSTTS